MIDWSDGAYEHTARDLAPAAEAVLAVARPQAGERVLDVACGTGNAAVLAARAGAEVAGADTARRLLDVAAERLRAEGIATPDLREADAATMPWAEASFDVVVSVFGVIFAESPEQVARELLRVARPGGRIVLTAWTAEGTIFRAISAMSTAVREPRAAPPPPAPAWTDEGRLQSLFPAASVEVDARELAFAAASPRAWLDEQLAHHPAFRCSRAMLSEAGRWEVVEEEMLGTLTDGNEDPGGFRATSRYLVVSVTPPS